MKHKEAVGILVMAVASAIEEGTSPFEIFGADPLSWEEGEEALRTLGFDRAAEVVYELREKE